MKFLNYLKSNQGSGLTTVMMGAGLMALAGGFIFNQIKDQNRHVNYTEAKLMEQELFESTVSFLADKDSCSAVLAGRTIPSNVNQLVQNGTTILTTSSPNNNYSRDGRVVLRLSAMNLSYEGGSIGNGASGYVNLDLHIERYPNLDMTQRLKILSGSFNSIKQVKLWVTMGPSGIQRCYSDVDVTVANVMKQGCSLVGGTFATSTTSKTCSLMSANRPANELLASSQYVNNTIGNAINSNSYYNNRKTLCPNNQFVNGFDGTGKLKCAPFTGTAPSPTPTPTPTPTATPTVCGGKGKQVNGICYHIGELGQSCDQVCAPYDGCNLGANKYVIGGANFAPSLTGGTAFNNCNAALAALGKPAVAQQNPGWNVAVYGCTTSVLNSNNVMVPTCEGASASSQRVCACNKGSTLPSCPGVSIGGHCWYAGEGGSCTDLCAEIGKSCNSAAIISYVGSGGSNANCQNVLKAVTSLDWTASEINNGIPVGCVRNGSVGAYRYIGATTTCNADPTKLGFYGTIQRMCACQ